MLKIISDLNESRSLILSFDFSNLDMIDFFFKMVNWQTFSIQQECTLQSIAQNSRVRRVDLAQKELSKTTLTVLNDAFHVQIVMQVNLDYSDFWLF